MTKRPDKTPVQGEKKWAVRLNRWTLWSSRHYLRLMLIAVALFVGLPFAAPVFMHLGLEGPGNVIYSMYSPLCHQFAFRSWFLFGEQSAYPRAEANLPGLRPYEDFLPQVNAALAGRLDSSTLALEMNSKAFLGDPQMGYKIAICQRDVGIYAGLFIGGLIYAIPYVRKRLRPVPILLYIFLGLGPIGLDGFSQLLSYPPFQLWEPRESTPLFRLATGLLFGLMNAWLAFPYLEASARDVIREIEAKFAARRQREAGAVRRRARSTS
ncbi:MAG: DUF2085 domain-containing protein [Anaerolineae bacterium]|nr:DUF2085 domain-containing protein [Anaerolineae bacterium]